MKLINTLIIFFELWGSYHYEERIDAAFAWELATIFEEHSDALEWLRRRYGKKESV